MLQARDELESPGEKEAVGKIIDDSTGVVERFANYKAAIGDITQIETEEREKLPFQVMATVNLGDQHYKGYFIFVPQDLLNEIKVNTTNFPIKLLFHANSEKLYRRKNGFMNFGAIIKTWQSKVSMRWFLIWSSLYMS